MVFRVPILETIENANIGGIAGFAIRPIVTDQIPVKPTSEVTVKPSMAPSVAPSVQPTIVPTEQPTNPPTQSPTIPPTQPTTSLPTTSPTIQPPTSPTTQPTNPPILPTTSLPTTQPTNPPTIQPTNPPTHTPTIPPTPTLTLTSCSQLDSLPSQLPSVTQLILSSEFDCDGTVDLKRFENCESIVIGSNAMENATSLDLSGMESLKSIEIGDDSYPSLTEIIVGLTEFSQLTNVTIGSNSLNSLTSLPFFPSLRSVTIGANSLTSVKQLVISEPSQLDDVTIGEGSLSGVEDLVLGNAGRRRRLADSGMTRYSGMSAFGLHSDGSGYIFSMNNRSVLRNVKKIEVKENSYNNVHRFEVIGLIKLERIVVEANSICGEGETSAFMVEECPSLQTVTIGDGSLREYGIVVMRENANLTRVELGAWSFNKAWSVELRDLGSLEELVMGDNALLGDNSTSRMTRSEYPYYLNSTLMMRNLPSLRSLTGVSNNLVYFGSVRVENIASLEESGLVLSMEAFSFTYEVEAMSKEGMGVIGRCGCVGEVDSRTDVCETDDGGADDGTDNGSANGNANNECANDFPNNNANANPNNASSYNGSNETANCSTTHI
ncbi:hypothetical protein WA538_002443 [Blastocystis sp. DL]